MEISWDFTDDLWGFTDLWGLKADDSLRHGDLESSVASELLHFRDDFSCSRFEVGSVDPKTSSCEDFFLAMANTKLLVAVLQPGDVVVPFLIWAKKKCCIHKNGSSTFEKDLAKSTDIFLSIFI